MNLGSSRGNIGRGQRGRGQTGRVKYSTDAVEPVSVQRGGGTANVGAVSSAGRGRGIDRGNVPARARGRGRGTVRGIDRGNVPARARGRGRGTVQRMDRDNVPAKARGRGRGGGQVIVDDFVQATSSNLPVVSCFTVADYYRSLLSSELRQSKDQISASADYGDNAIGYVKLKRTESVCTVKASITPQTSVNNTPYAVSIEVNESNKSLNNASCTCQASAGSCKHMTALIFWLLRRSEEPSPTEVACYWKKSVLSTVKGLKSKTIDELSGKSTAMKTVDNDILTQFIEMGKVTNKNACVIRYSQENRTKVTLFIDHLAMSFLENHSEDDFNAGNFIAYCSQEMTVDRCAKVFEETVDQNIKSEWYYQRFGRITASKLFESSRCDTEDGSLVAVILGARKFKGNAATKRGSKLESEVFDLLKTKKYMDIQKCGIVLRSDLPIFGASPDGINDTYVFEIKCPMKAETVKNYVCNGVLKDKVNYQMQLQMYLCGKRQGILVVADPAFESNHAITEYVVSLDEIKLKQVLKASQTFWENVIFKNLK